jgi:hypothetical protein
MRRSAPRALRNEEKRKLLAYLPDQEAWQEEDYLWLTDRSSQLVELSDGYLEWPPTPTPGRNANRLRFLRK